ncbi:MAG: UvrD-helicase domain-containing protein [Tannerella sp.]|jgi:ATP-dependent exoDNAse (exonuclease V) beta subunit|nr:UvrD-helicase domain-containing protein [Tannerella sp.]
MLTIYRASAGTGKTHTLTREYLRLLFRGTDVHSRILSVTFTNKATEEMKNRIIRELYTLASGLPSDFLSPLTDLYGQTEAQTRTQARKIMIRLLHDYSAFHISTIDHFFQQTMRAFIREIGLQGNYRVEMDRDLVLSESIDSLLAGLDRKEHKPLLEWLLRFSEDKVERGETWDIRAEVKKLGEELFKEKYKAYSDKIDKDIADKQALGRYRDTLYALIRATEAEARQIGEQGMAALVRYGLEPSDFRGGSRSALFFFEQLAREGITSAQGKVKEPSATFRDMAVRPDACHTKTTPPHKRQAIEDAWNAEVGDCLRRTVTFFDHLTNYFTAREIIRYYYTLGILSDISRQVKQWCEEKNCMLIADTTELLNRVIDGSDVPFIYEKTGTRIDHYMIDEFQDTSEMQWHNFRPLVHESLACRHDNLIVGDIKQSIYRFRNSDWTLLDEKVQEDFTAEQTTEETLAENWRSHRLIVEFNNTFFSIAPTLLQQRYNEGLDKSALSPEQRRRFANKIISAYNRSFLQVSPPFRSKDGHVRIELLSGSDGVSWKEEAMLRLPAVIERLQDSGYALRDIAILVRTRAEGRLAAETLLAYQSAHPATRYHYEIISEDALELGSSRSVRFMAGMLHYLNRPDDPAASRRARIAFVLLRRETQEAPERLSFAEEIKADFPEETIAGLRKLSHRSPYEMAEGIYRLFETVFPENEQIFIQSFLDLVAGYAEKEPAGMDKFLQWWKETGWQTKIAMPDTQNAIRILTIHKSKGLGFKAVIIPFGDWEADQKSGSILWCRPQEAPFNQLHLAPVGYSGALNRTLFAEEYYHEKLHAYIDNLNALYVAFTRAKEELIVFVPGEEVRPAKAISQLIRESLRETGITTAAGGEALQPLAGGFRAEEGLFEWGNWWPAQPGGGDAAEELPVRRLPSVLPDERIHLHLHRQGGFFDDSRRRYGVLMHDLLSGIRTVADIRPVVAAKEAGGEINRREAAEWVERLERLLSKPEVSRWFDGSIRVLNEAEILFDNGKSGRPDRIMMTDDCVQVVDYKSGEQKDARHRRQISHYCELIRRMGYGRVNGYLWYVELDEIEKVVV